MHHTHQSPTNKKHGITDAAHKRQRRMRQNANAQRCHRAGETEEQRNSRQPRYLQMYIWDTKHELHHRMNAILNFQLNHAIVHELKTMLNELNPYVSHLRYISELPKKNIANLRLMIHINIRGLDQRTHNASTVPQVAAIWINEDTVSEIPQRRNIILHTKMDKLVRISEFTRCYDPLVYPLFFPYGEQGWTFRQIPYKGHPFQLMSNNDCDVSIDIDAEGYQQSDAGDNVNPQNRMFISAMEYYAYQIQIRPNNINLIL
ncbi:6765_t:CDS:2 [Acaulospora morrowiae]|uniref:6765_t:CDS:1 n=1 Tax=Acaulospora morrowiae TaxID=94023 RepID=A0A9N9ID08_9GLOM|nr:6765_t:CDS:2 [Acaulospora morrowiae]